MKDRLLVIDSVFINHCLNPLKWEGLLPFKIGRVFVLGCFDFFFSHSKCGSRNSYGNRLSDISC